MPARFLPALRSGGEIKPHPALTREGLSERKVILADYYSALAHAGIDVGNRARPWPIERAIAEGYERVVWVFKSVEWIAGNSSRLPFRLREGKRVVDDHPLYRVLNKKANPIETGRQFRKRLSAQVLLSKRGAFVEVTKARSGAVVRADLLPPARTYPVPGTGKDLISHFAVRPRNGGKPREIAPEKVRWFRDPHPIDPYMGVTPLESIGMSIELDYFARLYNVSFMRNDGRPGGIIGINGDLEESEMDRVEARFGKGPTEAGKLSVIQGDLSYVDIAARPRDMQYGATSTNSKNEILAGFGLDESLFGSTANRTFDNAEQAEYNAWSGTMEGHNDLIATGWDEDSEDDFDPFIDTSTIESLQLPERAKRAEALSQVTAGLRSRYSFAVVAGYDDEIEDTPLNRALWIPAGFTPVPSRAEDADAIKAAMPQPPAVGGPPQTALPGAGDGASDGSTTSVQVGETPSPASRPAPRALPPGPTRVIDMVHSAHSNLAATGTEGKDSGGFRFRIIRREDS